MKALKKKPIQIYLEPRQDILLKVLSRKKGISKAAIIRESVDKFLKEIPVEEDAAMGLIGLGGSGKGDLSDKHDAYLVRYTSLKRK